MAALLLYDEGFMVSWIKRIGLWLRRCRYSRGFGVQSPWAYRFIRYVINEHYPYYQYSELKRKMPMPSGVRRLCEFYFRLVNFLQPTLIIDRLPDTAAYGVYMSAGCKKAIYNKVEDGRAWMSEWKIVVGQNAMTVVRMSLMGDFRDFTECVLSQADERTVLVVQGINTDAKTKCFWKELQADCRVGVTFDLYDCAVLFFDRTVYKQHYVVNF